MTNKLDMYNDLRKTQTMLHCMENTLIRATAGNVNDGTEQSFDLLYMLMDFVGGMVDKAGRQSLGGKEGAA